MMLNQRHLVAIYGMNLILGFLFVFMPENVLQAMLDLVGGGFHAWLAGMVGWIADPTLADRRMFGAISLTVAGIIGDRYVDVIEDSTAMKVLIGIGVALIVFVSIVSATGDTEWLDWAAYLDLL